MTTPPHDPPPDPRTAPAPAPAPDAMTVAADAASDDDGYSATVLADHWFRRPGPDSGTHAAVPVPVPQAGPTAPRDADRTLLRFGPGVTAALARGPRAALPAAPPAPPEPPCRRLRRHALPALVLAAALAFVLWRQQSAGPVAVREVTVTAARQSAGCDGTADVVAVVRTDGGPGTFSYRWVRNDGTASDVLHATVARGTRHTRLHLLWTFQGQGRFTAAAELRVLSPVRRAAEVRFSYDCP
ncbi:hypothetical protein [Streptomyces sp. NPDC059894]|uniref:hypothetical protein n=1 Tax=unclassified Streptomyces TaxID=2593676 RepID=UPI003667DDC3